MKLHILSDIHLGVEHYLPERIDADVVILAGDIAPREMGVLWALRWFADVPVIYVPGNHEYYGDDIEPMRAVLRTHATASRHMHLLDNDEVGIDGVRFLGATLWTNFRYFGEASAEEAMEEARRYMNDFRRIRHGGRPLRPMDMVERHHQSMRYLGERLRRPFNGPAVVVTHHGVSRRSMQERYRGALFNAAFCSNLYAFVESSGAAYWVHGHVHDAFDYSIGCPGEYGLNGFNPRLVVEVSGPVA